MNFQDLQEEAWRWLGYTDSNNRRNWRLQKIKDALNLVMFRMAKSAPSVWCLTGETTLSIVGGTAVYTLDDYCYKLLSAWTEDTNAHRIKFRIPSFADRDGSRNPSVAYPSSGGPWDAVWQPRAQPYKSGASGASTGASAARNSQTITLGASATPLTSADVGRMIRLNGEAADYKIVTIGAGGLVPTVDRPIIPRIQNAQANLTDGNGPDYTNVRWDLGRPNGFKIKVLPTPPSGQPTQTVYYRYNMIPRVMLANDDVPPFDEDYHDILWKGAIEHLAAQNEDAANFQVFSPWVNSRIAEMASQEQDTDVSDDSPFYDVLSDLTGDTARRPVDAYYRM